MQVQSRPINLVLVFKHHVCPIMTVRMNVKHFLGVPSATPKVKKQKTEQAPDQPPQEAPSQQDAASSSSAL